jgi:hypothetical protein
MIDLGVRGHSIANIWINSYEAGLVPAEVGQVFTDAELITMAE